MKTVLHIPPSDASYCTPQIFPRCALAVRRDSYRSTSVIDFCKAISLIDETKTQMVVVHEAIRI